MKITRNLRTCSDWLKLTQLSWPLIFWLIFFMLLRYKVMCTSDSVTKAIDLFFFFTQHKSVFQIATASYIILKFHISFVFKLKNLIKLSQIARDILSLRSLPLALVWGLFWLRGYDFELQANAVHAIEIVFLGLILKNDAFNALCRPHSFKTLYKVIKEIFRPRLPISVYFSMCRCFRRPRNFENWSTALLLKYVSTTAWIFLWNIHWFKYIWLTCKLFWEFGVWFSFHTVR